MIYDVFDSFFISRGLGVQAKSVKLELDYLISKKSKITLNNRYEEIRVNDLIINREKAEIYRVVQINNEQELVVYTGFDTINFPIFVQGAEIVSTDLEGYIATLIEDYWVNNTDTLIKLPITVNTLTTTNGNLLFFGKEDIDLRRICERAIQKYNIVVAIKFENVGVTVNIESRITQQHTFRLKDNFVNNFNFIETPINLNMLNWYAYDEFEALHNEVYYLLNDNTVTQTINDPKRITPVKEVVELIDIEDLTLEGAKQKLQGQLSNNKIVVYTNIDSSIDYIKLGDKVDIIYKDKIVKSQLTGIQSLVTTSQLKFIFGIGRNYLSDKLLRNEN